jgi:hypothetical protein
MTHDFSQLTIVVPTYNRRHTLVHRTAEHWRGTNAKVIIVDESADAMPQALRSTLPSEAEYHHVPSLNLVDRLRYGARLVHTKYAALCPDDNFLLHGGVGKCIKKLDSDPSLLGCAGIFSWFSYFRGRVIFLKQWADLGEPNTTSDDIDERLKAAGQNIVIYGVIRRDTLLACVEMTAPMHSCGDAGYYSFQFGLAYLGKWGAIRELMWLRSYEGEKPFSSSAGVDIFTTFHRWYEDDASFAPEVDDMVRRMISVLGGMTGDAPGVIEPRLRRACAYVASLTRAVQQPGPPRLWRRIAAVILPVRIKQFIRRFRYRYIPNGVGLAPHMKWLESQGVFVDHEEIAIAKRSILLFHD